MEFKKKNVDLPARKISSIITRLKLRVNQKIENSIRWSKIVNFESELEKQWADKEKFNVQNLDFIHSTKFRKMEKIV